MRRPDEHYVSRYTLKTPSWINKVVVYKEKPGKSVKFILPQALGYLQVIKYTLNKKESQPFEVVSPFNFKQKSLV
jgi:hypothetical protein